MMNQTNFLSGVIEGFYGTPWSFPNRINLMRKLNKWNLNTYIYAPKFDLKHRLRWYEPYSPKELSEFQKLIETANNFEINFTIAFSPGLSFDFKNHNHFQMLLKKYTLFEKMGVTSFALLLDDIPVSRAGPHNHCSLIHFLKSNLATESQWFFCPTIYSDWHHKKYRTAGEYLEYLSSNMDHSIYILWTGTTIISPDLTIRHLKETSSQLKHKIIFWDNIGADDYTSGHIIFPGPWPRHLESCMDSISGIVLNVSQHFHAGLPVIATFASFLKHPSSYDPDKEWEHYIEDLSPVPNKSDVLKYILGYFYTVHNTSPLWQELLQQISEILTFRNCSPETLIKRLTEIKDVVSDDKNLELFGDFWLDLYPFIKTLCGDLNYIIPILQDIGKLQRLPIRDKKWHTPIERVIIKHIHSQNKSFG